MAYLGKGAREGGGHADGYRTLLKTSQLHRIWFIINPDTGQQGLEPKQHMSLQKCIPGVNGIETVLPRTNSLVFCLAWGRLSRDAEFVACKHQFCNLTTLPS